MPAPRHAGMLRRMAKQKAGQGKQGKQDNQGKEAGGRITPRTEDYPQW